MYRVGIESILGLTRRDGGLHIDPCIPKTWPRYEMVFKPGRSEYRIVVENPERRESRRRAARARWCRSHRAGHRDRGRWRGAAGAGGAGLVESSEETKRTEFDTKARSDRRRTKEAGAARLAGRNRGWSKRQSVRSHGLCAGRDPDSELVLFVRLRSLRAFVSNSVTSVPSRPLIRESAPSWSVPRRQTPPDRRAPC